MLWWTQRPCSYEWIWSWCKQCGSKQATGYMKYLCEIEMNQVNIIRLQFKAYVVVNNGLIWSTLAVGAVPFPLLLIAVKQLFKEDSRTLLKAILQWWYLCRVTTGIKLNFTLNSVRIQGSIKVLSMQLSPHLWCSFLRITASASVKIANVPCKKN